MAIAYESFMKSSGGAIDSLTVTNMPTTTSYMQGDTLDTTGLVVTAVAGSLSGNVTSDCTITPTTLNTAGTQAITVTYEGATTTFNVTVEAIVGISVTTPPTKTSYNINDTLDLTGIVITATSANLTRVVTSQCTFSPADGATLDTAGTTTITVTWRSNTATTSVTVTQTQTAHIYGAEWAGTSDPSWTRTDEAANFADPNPYYVNMPDTPSSPFDNLMPWSGMQIVEDAEAGTLVKIPKFWYKWTKNGSALKLQISDGEQTDTGWHVSPAHQDRNDGSGERDFVYVGRYHCDSNYQSKTNVVPINNVELLDFVTNIHTLGSTIWEWEYTVYWTICMLYLVEFANWNSQDMIGYGGKHMYNSTVYPNGYTDSMPYHTGTDRTSRTTYGYIQYRYIENLWSDLYDYVAGIGQMSASGSLNRGMYYIYLNPINQNNSNIIRRTYLGVTKIDGSSSLVVTEWDYGNTGQGLLCPVAGITDTNYSTYSCDAFSRGSINSEKYGIYVGGTQKDRHDIGLFYIGMNSTGASSAIGSRLMKLP